MSRNSLLLLATTVVFATSTSVFGVPLRPSSAPDSSFSVFFDPGAASLSKEGREIISVAAERFAGARNRHPTANMLVTSESDDEDSASLSNERIKAVGNQLVSDGIPREFVSEEEHRSVHAESVRLLEALNRRVSISIQENAVIGRL